ncbi:MAG: hypothetical protein ACLFMZ_07560 [Spirochaetaceae bacterium]
MGLRGACAQTVVFVLILALAGCSSSPDPVTKSEEELPDWVTASPKETEKEVLFVGAGSAPEGEEDLAKDRAFEGVLSSVATYMELQKYPEEEFTAHLKRAVRRGSDPEVPGFTVKDTYVERRGSLVHVYVLGEYKKEALEEELKRLDALLVEEPDVVMTLEERADDLYAEHLLYKAAGVYIEAAAEAVSRDIENPEGEYRRLIQKAVIALGELSIERMNNNLQGYVRQSFSEAFRVRVTSTAEDNPGLEEIPLEVSYTRAAGSGERRSETASIVTDSEGIATFVRPPPMFAGDDTLTIILDAEEILEPLTSLSNTPEYFEEGLEKLRGAAAEKRVEFSYSINSRAKEISTAVWVTGFDNGGNVLPESDSSSGILEVLNEEDFNVSGISLDPSYADAKDGEIVERVEEEKGSRFQRLIFGSAYISDFRDEGSRYTVRVTGSVKAADLPSGFIYYDSGELSKSANGQNLQSAISAAFKQFGKHIGQELSKELP